MITVETAAAIARGQLAEVEEVAMAERKASPERVPSFATCRWLEEASGFVRMAERAVAGERERAAKERA